MGTLSPTCPLLLYSHSTVRLLLLQLPCQDLVRGQKSHTYVEEDLPEVPQPVQVHVAQENQEQHQYHLRSPGRTVEQVQVTLYRMFCKVNSTNEIQSCTHDVKNQRENTQSSHWFQSEVRRRLQVHLHVSVHYPIGDSCVLHRENHWWLKLKLLLYLFYAAPYLSEIHVVKMPLHFLNDAIKFKKGIWSDGQANATVIIGSCEFTPQGLQEAESHGSWALVGADSHTGHIP